MLLSGGARDFFDGDHDQRVPVTEARILAAEMRNARFVPLSIAIHFLLKEESARRQSLEELAALLHW
jgi:hypothetical protein